MMTSDELKKAADIVNEYLDTLNPAWYRRTISIGREISSLMLVEARRRNEQLSKPKVGNDEGVK